MERKRVYVCARARVCTEWQQEKDGIMHVRPRVHISQNFPDVSYMRERVYARELSQKEKKESTRCVPQERVRECVGDPGWSVDAWMGSLGVPTRGIVNKNN